ncbi:MAG: hypothetical protein AAF799_40400 [Myxococcota bacterium]
MRRSSILGFSLFVGFACGPGDPATASGGADASGGEEATSATGDDDAGQTSEAVDESGESTASEPEFEPYPARGITLTEIYADHGVHVPVYRDGAWVDGSGRNAELIANRNTLIRAYWELEPDFEPRVIEGRLVLTQPDGSQESASRLFMVEGNSVPNDLDTNIYFIAPAELVTPGVQFHIELYETTDDLRDTPEPAQSVFPAEPAYIGIESTPMELQVVIVPIDHDTGAQCPEPPEITDDELQYLSDQLFMQNPVNRVVMTRRDPIAYTQSMNSFNGVLGFLADLRATDGADPAAYYYGVVRPCDGGPDGVGGQAISIPGFPSMDNGWARTSVGRWYGSLSSTANTFVHEVGHTQGRRHIFCNGDEGGTDPSYPYDAGDIGVWGFGSQDFSLHSPTASKDYMTYCGNTWVSDWTWRQVSPYIRELTSWGAQGPVGQPEGHVLVGLVDPESGDETWFTTPGKATALPADGNELVRWTSTEGVVTALDAVITPMGDAGAYAIVSDLPEELSAAQFGTLTRLHDGVEISIDSLRSEGQQYMLSN